MNTQPNNNDTSAPDTGPRLPASIWVSWQQHTRTRNIAGHLGVSLQELTTDTSGLLRYAVLIARTVALLAARRPRLLIVQNPSVVLTVLTLALRPILRYKLVVDAHNEAVEPYLHQGKVLLWIARACMRAANLTLVTNEPLAKIVRQLRGRAFVLPDKVPDFPESTGSTGSDKLAVVLISTYAKDEPIEEFIDAAGDFAETVSLYITGRAEKLSAAVRARAGANIHFTGFLDERAYWQLLGGADAIADLTRMDNCLVCGAYEGVAAGKPLILSDNEATRTHFSKGALYVDNSVAGIKNALTLLQAQKDELRRQVMDLRQELREAWLADAQRLVTELRALG